MNDLCVDIGWKSINHYGEQLCGDHVDVVDQGENSQVIRFVDTNGDKLLNLDIKEIDMNGRTYIAMTQVPEPAEWAAIFGAVALGLAACRRRK